MICPVTLSECNKKSCVDDGECTHEKMAPVQRFIRALQRIELIDHIDCWEPKDWNRVLTAWQERA